MLSPAPQKYNPFPSPPPTQLKISDPSEQIFYQNFTPLQAGDCIDKQKWIDNSHRICFFISKKWIFAVYEAQNLTLYMYQNCDWNLKKC